MSKHTAPRDALQEKILESIRIKRPNCLASWLDMVAERIKVCAHDMGDPNKVIDCNRDEYLPRAATVMLDLVRIAATFVPLYPEPLAKNTKRLIGEAIGGLTPIAQGEPGRALAALDKSTKLYDHQRRAMARLKPLADSLIDLAKELRGHDAVHGMPDPTPNTEAEALRVMGARPSWRWDELEAVGLTESFLRRLDESGLIEVRPWCLHNNTTDPNKPKPPEPGPNGIGWASPISKPTLVGRGSDIYNAKNHQPGCSPEIRLTNKGRAALDRATDNDAGAKPAAGESKGKRKRHGRDHTKTKWLKLPEAEQVSDTNKGTIWRAAKEGKLKSNKKTGTALRIDALDLTRWKLERANKPESIESTEHVERLVKEHVKD